MIQVFVRVEQMSVGSRMGGRDKTRVVFGKDGFGNFVVSKHQIIASMILSLLGVESEHG